MNTAATIFFIGWGTLGLINIGLKLRRRYWQHRLEAATAQRLNDQQRYEEEALEFLAAIREHWEKMIAAQQRMSREQLIVTTLLDDEKHTRPWLLFSSHDDGLVGRHMFN